jgi:uncharacterized damage-inducible protein DinB
MKTTLLLLLALPLLALAQAPAAPPTVAAILDQQFTGIEREMVPLVEAMPADKMGFAPTAGEFKNVRTFAQQATHTAAVIYAVAAAILGEKNPTEMGTSENGPASIKTKEDVVKYVKDAFAYGHKALKTITAESYTKRVPSPFGQGQMVVGSLAGVVTWHSFDHYGQMVVYLRMNGIVPPASR